MLSQVRRWEPTLESVFWSPHSLWYMCICTHTHIQKHHAHIFSRHYFKAEYFYTNWKLQIIYFSTCIVIPQLFSDQPRFTHTPFSIFALFLIFFIFKPLSLICAAQYTWICGLSLIYYWHAGAAAKKYSLMVGTSWPTSNSDMCRSCIHCLNVCSHVHM